jgi:hypothetical protein
VSGELQSFLEQKPKQKSRIKILPQSNVDPLPPKTLALSKLHQISIPAHQRNLSCQKFPATKVVPGIQDDDAYLSNSYINGGSHQLLLIAAFDTMIIPLNQLIPYSFMSKMSID